MNMPTNPIWFGVLLILLGLNLPARAQGNLQMNGFLPQQSTASAPEDAPYKDGTNYLNEGKWDAAAGKFDQVAALGGKRADSALYWKAYALNKSGHRQDALATIGQLRKQYPGSTWLKDAGALELELRQASGQPVNPQEHEDEETKLLALNSLMNSDPKRALPILQKFLSSNNSSRLKAQALFVLAQSGSQEARQTLVQVARGQSNPELQRKAIQFLATEESPENVAALGEIYRTSNSHDVRKAVLDAYVACDCRKELLAAAQQERDPELRHSAIQQLGAAGGREELRQLYKSSASVDDKEAVIQGFIAEDDVEGLSEVVKTATDARIKSAAIRALGAVGGQQSKTLLLQMYGNEKDPEIKRSLIQGLFIQDDAHDLIQLARKESDRELRKYMVQQLSVMDDREAKDYMLEILNK
jgi:HEAT repeat protein